MREIDKKLFLSDGARPRAAFLPYSYLQLRSLVPEEPALSCESCNSGLQTYFAIENTMSSLTSLK